MANLHCLDAMRLDKVQDFLSHDGDPSHVFEVCVVSGPPGLTRAADGHGTPACATSTHWFQIMAKMGVRFGLRECEARANANNTHRALKHALLLRRVMLTRCHGARCST